MRDRQGRTVTRKAKALQASWLLVSVLLSGALGFFTGAAMRPRLFPTDFEVGQILGASLVLGLTLWLATRFAMLGDASGTIKSIAVVAIPAAAVIGGPFGAGLFAS